MATKIPSTGITSGGCMEPVRGRRARGAQRFRTNAELVVDKAGITALIRDEHGTAVTIQGGWISVNVAAATEAK